ncbi:hypothetical protein VAC51_00035 [Variovorax phage VAC_51]|uniref:Uncharacterized protein n=1 Tax=Variovorax phage VAC_51 TaxID=2985242 RepID=A0A9N6WVL4_9CAUD|nr:hypothetical protein VAC51_00035 [Variovorax phage VAC_51]
MTYQRNDTPAPLAEDDITEEQMQAQEQPEEEDFLSGVQACDLSGEGECEACQ